MGRWKKGDAALALNYGLTLVTRNHTHFKPARDGFVMVPYRL
jgi:predicted nucleic acid-binding protein